MVWIVKFVESRSQLPDQENLQSGQGRDLDVGSVPYPEGIVMEFHETKESRSWFGSHGMLIEPSAQILGLADVDVIPRCG